jgi:hypothetical protein
MWIPGRRRQEMDRSETHMLGIIQRMKLVSKQHMPLSSAYLCENCHCVGNRAEQCPACASESLMSLAGVLNREQPKKKAQMTYAQMDSCLSLL